MYFLFKLAEIFPGNFLNIVSKNYDLLVNHLMKKIIKIIF